MVFISNCTVIKYRQVLKCRYLQLKKCGIGAFLLTKTAEKKKDEERKKNNMQKLNIAERVQMKLRTG